MTDRDEEIAFITKAARAKVNEAREKLRRAEKELDLTYRSIYNLPKNAVALERWYDEVEITVMRKGGLPPLIISDNKPPSDEEWSSGEIVKTPIRINGVWQ